MSCQRISAKDTENYVSKVPKLYKEITQQLRKTILDNFPHLNEAIKWGNPVYYTDENLFYVSANKDHVKLGFFLHGPDLDNTCLLNTSPSPRDLSTSRMPSSA